MLADAAVDPDTVVPEVTRLPPPPEEEPPPPELPLLEYVWSIIENFIVTGIISFILPSEAATTTLTVVSAVYGVFFIASAIQDATTFPSLSVTTGVTVPSESTESTLLFPLLHIPVT